MTARAARGGRLDDLSEQVGTKLTSINTGERITREVLLAIGHGSFWRLYVR
jgi:hypothetical protein